MVYKKRLRDFLKSLKWAIWTLLVGAGFQASHSLANETLNYLVIEDQAEPFQIVDHSNRYSGIVSDLLFKIFERSNYQLKVNSYPFKRMIRTINDRTFPYWITYGSSHWGPPQNSNLSECSILTVKHILLPPKDEVIPFQGVGDLMGQRVILLFGFEYPYLDSYIEAGQMAELRVQSYPSAFKALTFKRGIGFIEMESRIKYNLKKMGERYSDYHPIDMSNTIPQYDIRFALSPQMPDEVKHYIDDRCHQLKRSGEYERIVNKYLN